MIFEHPRSLPKRIMKNSWLISAKEKAKKSSRIKKHRQFYSLFSKEQTVLDVGVYPEGLIKHEGISTNHFVRSFPFASENYTGMSIDSMEGMSELYPGKKFVQYDGGIFPFEDEEFDWAYSNAVIEHVGDYESKLIFLKEMIRVSRNVFFTTPNKYFPVDAHTMVLFIHWNDSIFYKWREWTQNWVPKETLNLLSLKEIRSLLEDADVSKRSRIIRNKLLGMTMTYTIVIQ